MQQTFIWRLTLTGKERLLHGTLQKFSRKKEENFTEYLFMSLPKKRLLKQLPLLKIFIRKNTRLSRHEEFLTDWLDTRHLHCCGAK